MKTLRRFRSITIQCKLGLLINRVQGHYALWLIYSNGSLPPTGELFLCPVITPSSCVLLTPHFYPLLHMSSDHQLTDHAVKQNSVLILQKSHWGVGGVRGELFHR